MRVFPLFLSSSCLVMLNLLFVDIAYSFLPGLSSSWSFGRVLTANTIQYSLKNQPFPLRNNDFILSAINGGADSLSNSNSKAKLLNDPNPNSIGNFFENKTEDTSFIQCYMLALGEVQGTQYGVGFPIDMPVMLTYFEDNELKPVRNNFEDFDHLVNHVSVQLENNDLYLYNTPVVLTLQGEFEDETMNDAYTPRGKVSRRTESEMFGNPGRMEGNLEDNEEEDDDEEEEEVTVEEVIAMEGLDNEDSYDDDEDDEDFADDDDDEDEDEDGSEDDADDPGSFWNSSPAGKNNQLKDIPDFSVYRPEKPDLSGIPDDAFVTEEDTKSLRRAHRKADKIIQYAADIKLIASFHYKKKNYHLVKLLEPMFLVGKRIMDIKGYYFTLLDDDESAKITPQLEKLLMNRPKPKSSDSYSSEGSRVSSRRQVSSSTSSSSSSSNSAPSTSDGTPRRSSRRKWKDRKSGATE